jgi:hypothetical protein
LLLYLPRLSRKSKVSEIVIFPEMIEAGVDQLLERKKKKLRNEQTVICVFLAMQGFLEMQRLRGDSESIH